MNKIQKAIIRTLAYFDIFDYPLKFDEVHRFLFFERCSVFDLKGEADALVKSGKIFKIGDFLLLKNSHESIAKRHGGMRKALRMWKVARFMSHVIKRFPYVKAVFVSGALAKLCVDKDTDIDFFIVTEPKRLWLCRTLMIAFKKVFLLNRKKFFCVNYFITSDHLEIEDKNIFTAVEIATLKPVFGINTYFEFMHKNSWIKNYLPNFRNEKLELKPISERKSVVQALVEKTAGLMNGRKAILDKIDGYLMKKWSWVWKVRYPELTDEQRDLMFRCRPYVSKAHPGDFQTFVLSEYERRVKMFGITAYD